MENSQQLTNNILAVKQLSFYIILTIAMSALISFWPIFGIWISLSLILTIWSKDNDDLWLNQILLLIIFGPVGRFLAPGSLLGSFWAFDFLIAFGLVIRLWQNRISWPKNDFACYFLIFSLIGLVSSSLVFPVTAVMKGSLYSLRWLAYYLAIKGLRGIKGLKGRGRTIGGIGVILAILGFIQLLVLPAIPNTLVAKYAFDPHVYRLFSTWVDPNFLAGFLVLSLLLSLEEKPLDFARGKGLKGINGRGRAIGTIGLLVLGILLTYSRSGYLALLAGLLVYYKIANTPKLASGISDINSRSKSELQGVKKYLVACCEVFYLSLKAPKLILGLILTVLILVNLVTPIRERILGAFDLDITAKQRLASWDQAWQIIKNNPIVGVGYNLYPQATASLRQADEKIAIAYNPATGGSDSSLLTIWATAGIGGLVIYLLIIWQIWQTGTVMIKASLASLLVHSLFVNSLLLPPFMLLLWLMRAHGQNRQN